MRSLEDGGLPNDRGERGAAEVRDSRGSDMKGEMGARHVRDWGEEWGVGGELEGVGQAKPRGKKAEGARAEERPPGSGAAKRPE